jgi:hypothetical protein
MHNVQYVTVIDSKDCPEFKEFVRFDLALLLIHLIETGLATVNGANTINRTIRDRGTMSFQPSLLKQWIRMRHLKSILINRGYSEMYGTGRFGHTGSTVGIELTGNFAAIYADQHKDIEDYIDIAITPPVLETYLDELLSARLERLKRNHHASALDANKSNQLYQLTLHYLN